MRKRLSSPSLQGWMLQIAFLQLLLFTTSDARHISCRTAKQDCPGMRMLCYEGKCRHMEPCNKDNDCYFFGTVDAKAGDDPGCFRDEIAERRFKSTAYGSCWLAADAHASGLEKFRPEDEEDFVREREALTDKDFDPFYEFELGDGGKRG